MAGSAPRVLNVLAFDVFGTVVDLRSGIIVMFVLRSARPAAA